MTARKELFINYSLFCAPVPIGLGNNSIIKAFGLGSIRISMTANGVSRMFELQDVYYILDMGTNNLLSVIYMIRKDYTINFGTNLCEISKAGLVIGKAENRKGLWVLDKDPIMLSSQAAYVAKVLLDVWHKQLGHAMTCSVQRL